MANRDVSAETSSRFFVRGAAWLFVSCRLPHGLGHRVSAVERASAATLEAGANASRAGRAQAESVGPDAAVKCEAGGGLHVHQAALKEASNRRVQTR